MAAILVHHVSSVRWREIDNFRLFMASSSRTDTPLEIMLSDTNNLRLSLEPET